RDQLGVTAPTNVGAPPLVGHAQTWTVSMPLSVWLPRSAVQPARRNGCWMTPLPGVSIDICGLGVGAVTAVPVTRCMIVEPKFNEATIIQSGWSVLAVR